MAYDEMQKFMAAVGLVQKVKPLTQQIEYLLKAFL